MKKWWIEPGFVACQTSRFNGIVNYNIKMTTLHDRFTMNKQINGKKYRTEKQTNNSHQKVEYFFTASKGMYFS